MPNPKAGTVTTDLGGAIRESRRASSNSAPDRTGIVGHVRFGKGQLHGGRRRCRAGEPQALQETIDRRNPAWRQGAGYRARGTLRTSGAHVWAPVSLSTLTSPP